MILNTLRVRYCPVMDTSEGGEREQHEPVPLIGKIGHQRAQDEIGAHRRNRFDGPHAFAFMQSWSTVA